MDKTLRLRPEGFPYPSAHAASQATGIPWTTLWRVTRGRIAPSPRVIGTLLTATGKTFDELFEVVDVEEEPARVGS